MRIVITLGTWGFLFMIVWLLFMAKEYSLTSAKHVPSATPKNSDNEWSDRYMRNIDTKVHWLEKDDWATTFYRAESNCVYYETTDRYWRLPAEKEMVFFLTENPNNKASLYYTATAGLFVDAAKRMIRELPLDTPAYYRCVSDGAMEKPKTRSGFLAQEGK